MSSEPFQKIQATVEADPQVAENGLGQWVLFTVGEMFLAEQIAFSCFRVGAMMKRGAASDFGQRPLEEDGVVFIIFH